MYIIFVSSHVQLTDPLQSLNVFVPSLLGPSFSANSDRGRWNRGGSPSYKKQQHKLYPSKECGTGKGISEWWGYLGDAVLFQISVTHRRQSDFTTARGKREAIEINAFAVETTTLPAFGWVQRRVANGALQCTLGQATVRPTSKLQLRSLFTKLQLRSSYGKNLSGWPNHYV